MTRASCLARDSVKADAARAFQFAPDIEHGMPDVYRRLGERGWLAVNWPAEYGGLGKSIAHKAILTEELIAHGVPDSCCPGGRSVRSPPSQPTRCTAP